MARGRVDMVCLQACGTDARIWQVCGTPMRTCLSKKPLSVSKRFQSTSELVMVTRDESRPLCAATSRCDQTRTSERAT